MGLFKILKWIKSYIRICYLKLVYGKKFSVKLNNMKSLYIGKNVQIKINKGCKLVLGDNVYIDDYCKLKCVDGNIYIGSNTFFNANVNLISLKKITIGENCLFAPNVGVYDHDHKYDISNILIRKQGFNTNEINRGSNIWIGCNCTITRGVNICNDVVIAANSVVTKELDKSGVYVGSPCKLIKNI